MNLRSAHALRHEGPMLHLRVTTPYVVAASQRGGTTVLEYGPGNEERSWTFEVGFLWDIACFQDNFVVANHDGGVRLWNLITREMVHEFLGHAEPVRAVLMPNKDTVVSSTNQGVIRVWDVSSRHCRHELTGHEGDIPCLAVHGNILISGSSDSSVRVWDIQTGHCMQVLEGHDASFGILGFNQDSTLLAAGGIGGALEVWRLHDGLKIAECVGHAKIPTMVQDFNGRLLTASADGTIREWDWNSGQQMKIIEAHKDKAIRGTVFLGKQLITASVDGRIKVWDYGRSCITQELSIEGRATIWTLQKLDEGSVIATVKIQDGSQSLRIWDISQS